MPASAGLLAALAPAAASAAVTAGLAASSMAVSALVSTDGSNGCTSTLQRNSLILPPPAPVLASDMTRRTQAERQLQFSLQTVPRRAVRHTMHPLDAAPKERTVRSMFTSRHRSLSKIPFG